VAGAAPSDDHLIGVVNKYLRQGYNDLGPAARRHLEDMGIDPADLRKELEAEELVRQTGNQWAVNPGELPDDISGLAHKAPFTLDDGSQATLDELLEDIRVDIAYRVNAPTPAAAIEDLVVDDAARGIFRQSIYDQISMIANDEDALRAGYQLMEHYKAIPALADDAETAFWALVEDFPNAAIFQGIQPGGRIPVDDLIDRTIRKQIKRYEKLADLSNPELVAEAIIHRAASKGTPVPDNFVTTKSMANFEDLHDIEKAPLLEKLDTVATPKYGGRQVFYYAVDEGDDFLIDMIWKGGDVDIRDAEGSVMIMGELAEHPSELKAFGEYPPKHIIKVEHYTGHSRHPRKLYNNKIEIYLGRTLLQKTILLSM